MAQRKKAGVSPKTIKWIWGVVFAPFALLAVMLLLTALGLFGRMPSFEELENPRSNLATEIYSEDGKVIGSFFVQNRSYVQYEDLFPADSAFHIRLDGHDMPPIVAALIESRSLRVSAPASSMRESTRFRRARAFSGLRTGEYRVGAFTTPTSTAASCTFSSCGSLLKKVCAADLMP